MGRRTLTITPTRKLTPRQSELLKLFVVDGENVARFQGDKINDWNVIKNVFLTLGATWKKGRTAMDGGFQFPEDVDGREVVRLACEAGEIIDPKEAGFFPTPADLADQLVNWADIRPGHRVLEPSAGHGALVKAVQRRAGLESLAGDDDPIEVVAVELLPDSCAKLAANCTSAEIVKANFLSCSPKAPWAQFDRVVMNPPFACRDDVRHILHAIEFLKPHGKLISVASAGIMYRTDKLTRSLRERPGVSIEPLPALSFKESGTSVNTCVVHYDHAEYVEHVNKGQP